MSAKSRVRYSKQENFQQAAKQHQAMHAPGAFVTLTDRMASSLPLVSLLVYAARREKASPFKVESRGSGIENKRVTWKTFMRFHGPQALTDRRRSDHFGLTVFLFNSFFLAFFGTTADGSSSPSTGGFPLPTRAKMVLTLVESARRARCSKYSSVRIAETFSASASVMSWLRATPLDSAALRASAKRLGGTRKAKLLRLIA